METLEASYIIILGIKNKNLKVLKPCCYLFQLNTKLIICSVAAICFVTAKMFRTSVPKRCKCFFSFFFPFFSFYRILFIEKLRVIQSVESIDLMTEFCLLLTIYVLLDAFLLKQRFPIQNKL